MATVKRTYKISEETLRTFEAAFPSGARSQQVERIMRESTESLRLQALRTEVAQGLKAMAEVGEETAREWGGVESEGWPAPFRKGMGARRGLARPFTPVPERERGTDSQATA